MHRNSVRLLVVSNRLPISLSRCGEGWSVEQGKGGLVTALAPVLRNRGGDWIGWPGSGCDDDLTPYLSAFSKKAGYNLHGVNLTEDEVQGFYQGFSNEIIWPLFHDFQSRCNFVPDYFRSYLDVNRKFAEVIAAHSTGDDYVWVHDYHLMHAAQMLRILGHARRTGFFLHIPFPPQDIFLKLPWRQEIIRALLEFDLVGFQTFRDRRNFLQCAVTLCRDLKPSGRGPVVHLNGQGRQVKVGYFPISIDYREFSNQARTRAAAEQADQVHAAFRRRFLIIGADRLDYSKGIPERLEAMRTLLLKYPELREKLSLVQIVVPSRETVQEYQTMKQRIESLVSEINGQFAVPGWSPIHYQYRNLDRAELVAYYRASRMALVTPLRDGMNLVAKEYCACNLSGDGVLVLSEFAGAAAQLQRGALLVNPYDTEGVADAIFEAYHMVLDEKRARMHKMQTAIRKYDIYWWVDSFLKAAFDRQLDDFPPQEVVDYHGA
ncbi:trehalose 6-phosphate synthase [Desulfobaculum xiamenense]|uniref:Glucosylglycerol-phosphate synthase n=1 Tax=Desulfobaculum xiamenense TaxID=995050 RepID=A0A846QEW1_9BACT|nr:trehalose-6-phosphate synthase [Desulfobaculum xiamenense]NJB66888.1 trehalose 6-phosphate synthase [Desulfobaculum xiamenense]